MRTLVWFRGKDLRVSDHAPLVEATRSGELISLFVLDPFFFAPERAKTMPHRIQFLLDSLSVLQRNIEHLGSSLLVVPGKSTDVVPELVAHWKIDRVVAHRWTEPLGRERDRRVAARLSIPFDLFEGETLLPPGTLRTGAGTPYAVYSPFLRALRARAGDIEDPLPAPRKLPGVPADVLLDAERRTVPVPRIEELGIERNPHLVPSGERAARDRLKRFLSTGASEYAEHRDRLDLPGTSRLSQDLKFGLLSARTVFRAAEKARTPENRASLLKFENELVWREFAYATLWDRPEVLEQPFRADFRGFPWRSDPAGFTAWTEGRTGYPVVDAAARQLLHEGFVHNRARMIAGSFLTKHLLVDYRLGERHYLQYLTDGDWASNNLGWQWVAGSGCDAQPYFRVFNPVSQGERFDPEGGYVRRWVPELSRLANQYIHRPWEAPEAELSRAGVRLGVDYPKPIVEHEVGRARFLAVAAEHLASHATKRGGRLAAP